MQIDDLITEWKTAKALLDSSKAEELVLRKQILSTLLNALDWGANKASTGTYNVTVTLPKTFKVDPSFPAEWANSPVIRTKYEIVAAEYKKLTEDQQRTLAQWVTVQPGSPALAVK